MNTKTKQTKMNVRLLRRVQKQILAEPKRFDMLTYFNEEPKSPCGTTACIGGWAIALSHKFKSLKDGIPFLESDKSGGVRRAVYEGQRVLSLTNEERKRLFDLSSWPQPLQDRYWRAKTKPTMARIAAERIDHFIKTKGRE